MRPLIKLTILIVAQQNSDLAALKSASHPGKTSVTLHPAPVGSDFYFAHSTLCLHFFTKIIDLTGVPLYCPHAQLTQGQVIPRK